MSGITNKSANVTAPFGDGAANTSVRFYTCDATSKNNALPAGWAGKFVLITNETANAAQFFVSKNSGASCDETLTAQDAGRAAVDLGGVILGGATRHLRLPTKEDHETLYLVRASASTATLRVELASD